MISNLDSFVGRKRVDRYILNGHTPVPEPDLFKWAAWIEEANEKKVVKRTPFPWGKVSTVFLGLDHSFGGGCPVLFETMVFGGKLNDEMEQCSTWEQAEAMHERWVARCTQEGAV